MFSNRIKNLRRSIGLNQIDFARALNVTQAAVSHWETGRSYPDTHQLLRIAKFFSISVDELTNGIQIHVDPPSKEEKEELEKITYDRPLHEIPETNQFSHGSGMNRETPLDAAPDQMTVDERFSRLSPERRKQALDFLSFLEQQPDD